MAANCGQIGTDIVLDVRLVTANLPVFNSVGEDANPPGKTWSSGDSSTKVTTLNQGRADKGQMTEACLKTLERTGRSGSLQD